MKATVRPRDRAAGESGFRKGARSEAHRTGRLYQAGNAGEEGKEDASGPRLPVARDRVSFCPGPLRALVSVPII